MSPQDESTACTQGGEAHGWGYLGLPNNRHDDGVVGPCVSAPLIGDPPRAAVCIQCESNSPLQYGFKVAEYKYIMG